MIGSLPELTGVIVEKHRAAARRGAIVVAVSGIDAAGKGTLAAALAAALRDRGTTVESIGADAWLNPPERLDLEVDPGGEFYRRGVRFDEMFDGLDRMRNKRQSLDVILVEGIFLFRRALRHRYDLSIWVDCSFEAALRRALARNQEGLPHERLLADYRRIYFPAQEIHLRRDRPRDFADVVVPGDLELRAGSIHSQNS